jgi:predicted DsbA family dithiol-disulfide isomerase
MYDPNVRNREMATLKDIARETGLDFRSVSHVLHRNDTRYSAETRRRVQEAARRLGFVANQAGRRLARAPLDAPPEYSRAGRAPVRR